MPAGKPFSLGKSGRLKSRKQIDILFDKGKKISLFPFRLMYRLTLIEPAAMYDSTGAGFSGYAAESSSSGTGKMQSDSGTQPDILQAGFTVSSKNFPRAVDRNRIKRLTREGYRIQKNELQHQVLVNNQKLHLFFIYTAREIMSFAEIKAKLKQILDKMQQVINENTAPRN